MKSTRAKRDELRRSLAAPHPESEEFAELGLDEWATSLPAEDISQLVDLESGTPVRWIAGQGFVIVEE